MEKETKILFPIPLNVIDGLVYSGLISNYSREGISRNQEVPGFIEYEVGIGIYYLSGIIHLLDLGSEKSQISFLSLPRPVRPFIVPGQATKEDWDNYFKLDKERKERWEREVIHFERIMENLLGDINIYLQEEKGKTCPPPSNSHEDEPELRNLDFIKSPKDRKIIELFFQGLHDSDILEQINKEFKNEVKLKTVTNRISELRKAFGEDKIPLRGTFKFKT